MQAYEELEVKFGNWVTGKRIQAVACSSGTSALQLALATLPLQRRSKVLMPEFTMIACPRAATMAGLLPEFVDCDKNLQMDLDKLEYALHQTCEVSAIMAVHIYGRSCDMDRLHKLARLYNVRVIEDMAEASTMKPHEMTDASCWSFYANKIISGEEGGAVIFRDDGMASRARQLRCLGFTEDHNFNHLVGGMNAKLSNANASLVLESLDKANTNFAKRRTLETCYNDLLPKDMQMPYRVSPWVYDIRMFDNTIQKRVMRNLKNHACGARYGFKPMSGQVEYCRYSNQDGIEELQAYKQSQRVIYLSLDPQKVSREYQEDAARIIVETIRDGYTGA